MIKNGAGVIHLLIGLVIGYPPHSRIKQFKEYIKIRYKIPVSIGTEPIPLKCYSTLNVLSFWNFSFRGKIISHLLNEDKSIMELYN